MDRSRTVTEINDNFSRKSQIIPTPVYFAPPLKEFLWELGTGARSQKTRIMWLWAEIKFDDISSRMDTIYQRDGQTDGLTD